jgi:tetratricopeptide (TPR) repeat protein
MSSNSAAEIVDWRRDPRLVEIDALSREGRLDEAFATARAAAIDGVKHPLIFSLIAWDHRRCGRLPDAIACMRRALDLDPGEPSLLLMLGGHLAAAGQPHEALEAFEGAGRRAPNHPFVLVGKARALLRLGAYAEAEPLFHRALALAPGDTDALAGLAGLACQRGDNEGARRLVEQILALEPGNIEAALVTAETAVAERRWLEAEATMRPLLSRRDLAELDRATALILLADALHGQGRHQEAFAAYEAGNAGFRLMYRSRFEALGVEREVDRAARLFRYFRRADRDGWRSSPLDGDPDETFPEHLFVIGFPRSGTTLLENIFDAHPRVAALDEVPTLAGAVGEWFGDDAGLDRLASADAAALRARRREHAAKVEAQRPDASSKLLVEKLPLFGMYVPLIRKLFPRAKIVFALRDPRDVVLSCLRRRFLINSAMYEFTALETAARFYDRVMTLSQACLELTQPEVLYLRNEDLVADFDGWAHRLCEFAGLEWSEAVRDFAEAARRKDIRTPSANQVRAGINSGGVGQWRTYRTELEPVLPILEPWVRRFGYPAD